MIRYGVSESASSCFEGPILNERTIGLNANELKYVKVLMEKIKSHCVPEFWNLGYAGLTYDATSKFDKSESGITIHDFENPFPNLRISILPFLKDAKGEHRYEPLVNRKDFPRHFNGEKDDSFSAKASRWFSGGLEKLEGKSVISVAIPPVDSPKNIRWMERNALSRFLLNMVRKIIMPRIDDLKNTLEHELIHYKDPSIKVKRKNSTPIGLVKKGTRKEPEDTTQNYDDHGRGYLTSGGQGSGGVPKEFYPRIWTIVRSCKTDGEKKELADWIRRPVPILPKCMDKESEFVRYTWENPSLRRMFLKKLYDGMHGRIS